MSMLEKFKEHCAGKTSEELRTEWEKMFPPENNPPKGWVNIEEHLPMMYAMDIGKGYSEFKVRYKDGDEGVTQVSDHGIWYHFAHEQGITHWFND